MPGSSNDTPATPPVATAGELAALVLGHDWGATALGPIESWPQSLRIALDIGMPVADGYELIRRVRELGWNGKALPAVALTAFSRPEDRRRASLAGFQTHVSKPVDPDELVAIVATLLGRTGGSAG
jgi:CheY-like chemotaxis protein